MQGCAHAPRRGLPIAQVRLMRLVLLLLAFAAALPGQVALPAPEPAAPPEFVQAVEFPYYLYPRTLWERELVWLKTVGIRTVEFSIPWNWHQVDGGACDFTGATSPRRDLLGFIRLLRRLEMRAWIRPLPPVKGWVNNGYPHGYQQGVAQDRKAVRPWLHELENLLAPQTEKHGGPIAFVEGGTSINEGILDAPPPPLPVTVVSAHDPAAMNRSRQALAAAGGALLWEDVEDALFRAGWERPVGPLYRAGAVSLSGDERATVSALRRNAALLRHWAALLPGMKPERAHPVRLSTGKLPPGVTAMELVSRAPGGPSAVSIANESRQPFRNMMRAWDPFTKRSIEIENVDLAPHQTLWLPVNVSLGGAGLCRECTAFSNAEHIVYATAELQTIEFENGTLAMEFCAPAPAEAVLQLARRPSGPYLAGGHLADFDFDEKTLRARLKIPQGKGPASQIRVALAIEAPEHSAFFEEAKRLIIGGVNTLSTSYSSEQLAARPRASATIPARIGAFGRSHPPAFRRRRGSGRGACHHPHRRLGRPHGGRQYPQQLPGNRNLRHRARRRGLSVPSAQNGAEFRRDHGSRARVSRLPRWRGGRPARLGCAVLRWSEAGDSRPIRGDPARPGSGVDRGPGWRRLTRVDPGKPESARGVFSPGWRPMAGVRLERFRP